MRILIVEDDTDMRQALQRVLEDKGHTVCWAAGGIITTGGPTRTLEVSNPLAGALLILSKPIRLDRLDSALAMLTGQRI